MSGKIRRHPLLAVAGLALALAGSAPAAAQVTALDAWANVLSATPGNQSGTVTSSSLTVSPGADRLFLAAVCLEISNSNTTVTTLNVSLGGTSLTQIGTTGALSRREHCYLGYLTAAQLPAFPATVSVQYAIAANTVSGLHVNWGSYTAVDQASPLSDSAAAATSATSLTFGQQIDYLANGLTLFATANGGNPATLTPPTDFSQVFGLAGSGHTSFVAATAAHGVAGNYPSTTTVSFGGTTSNRSALVVASLRPVTITNGTATGTVTASASGCSSIVVSAPYTGDADSDNTISYRTRTPTGTGTWSGSTSLPHSATPYGFTIPGLTHGAGYDIEVTYLDPDGVVNTNPQIVGNVVVGPNCTGAGTASAAQASGATPSIAVSAPYTFDNNTNNTLSYRIRTPSGSGTWSGATPVAHAASPYAFSISALTCGASYDVEVTYADADGIGSGTAVQTVSNVQLTACTLAGTVTASGGACGSITASAPYSEDLDGNNTVSYRYRTPTGTGAWSTPTALPHAVSPVAISVTGLAAGSYDLEVTYADAAGVSGTNPQTVTNLTVSANCTTTGAATAAATSCTAITVSAPFTGDANSNGTTAVEYNSTNSWPGVTACASLSGASPRSCPVAGLANASAYYFRVTFTDADGVSGTNPQVLGPIATLDCRVTPQAAAASADSCSRVTVTAPFSGDADGDSRTSVNRGTAAGGPFPDAICSNLPGASPRSCADTTVAASSTYFYQVTFTDPDGIVGGATQVAGPATTPVCTENRTTPGTASMVASGCRQITVTAPFAGDGDNDGAVLVEYNLTNTWPGTAACGAIAGPSPRMCLISGLNPSSVYFVRVTFSDPDGLLGGTNPQLLGSATTTACTGNGAPPMILPLAPSTNAVVGGVERFRVQVYDPDDVATANVLWGLDGGALANTGVALSTAYSCNLESQTTCKIFEFDVITSALSNGSHFVTVQATDSAAAPAAVARRSWAFVVNNNATAAAGSGELLRRTHGSQLCIDCHNLGTHSSQATSFTYGSWAQECLTCHTPHATKNIYLVRETIETPASGPKALDFRNLSGKADFSFATATTPGNGACEVCHTRTKNTDGTPRYRNSGGSDGGKHYSTNCVACHGHGKGFAAGESNGGTTCSGCHSDIWNGMQVGSTKVTKHRLSLDTFSDDTRVWPDETSGTLATVDPALRSCVNMCHNDHPHTLTSPVTTTHENNAYLDATSPASRAAASRTSSDKDKTDFEAAQVNGGMCLSCHRSPLDAAHAAVDKTAYDASAHDYTTFSTFGSWTYTLHDGGVFNRNCTKCHAGRNDARPAENAVFFEAVHFSDYPSLLGGSTNPNGAPATFVCYNCHGGGATGADLSGKAVYQDGVKAIKHPMDADAIHNSVTESANAVWGNSIGATGRHSNCQDCHSPHAAQRSLKQGAATAGTTTTLTDSGMNGRWAANQWNGSLLQITSGTLNGQVRNITATTAAGVLTVGTAWASAPAVGTTYSILNNKADGALHGAWGAQLSSNPALWTAPGSANFTKKNLVAGADLEATLCFKCHSSYYWGAGTAPNGVSPNGTATNPIETDVAMEFNPNNASGHPVLVGLSSYGAASIAPKPMTTAQMKAPWNNTAAAMGVGVQTMACSDCHNTDAASPAAQGPHGSALQFMLRGPNSANWPNVILSSGFATSWCANCHNNSAGEPHSRGDHSVLRCYQCHVVIPHGGKLARLIGDSDSANMPARYAYNSNKATLFITGFTKTTTANYSKNNCGTTAASGCTGDHPTTNGDDW